MATKEDNPAIPKRIESRLEQKMNKEWRDTQPIEMLLEMVEEGEIDPWDLEIIKVADKFLTKVEEMERENLRISGNTLLFSSILLRIKSEKLVGDDEEQSEEMMYDDHDWTPCFYEPDYQELPELELPARRESSRSATLIDLIDEFENAMETKQRRKERNKEKVKQEKETQEKVKNLAHEEDIEQDIDKVNKILQKKFEDKNQIYFKEITENQSRKEIISKYIPLLFLASRKKIWIEQDNINQEIKIKPREPEKEKQETKQPQQTKNNGEDDGKQKNS